MELIDIVKEKGIVNIINDYKKQMEYLTIIDKYTIDNEKTNWYKLSNNENNLDIYFLELYENKVYWTSISYSCNLTIEIIRRFADKLQWMHITSRYYSISETFIEEFEHYIDWYMLSFYIEITPALLKRWKHRLHLKSLLLIKKIPSSDSISGSII